eukprot:s2372_g3.t1
MGVTLYHYPLTRSTRVLWLLHELGDKVKFECKRVELMRGEGQTEEFLKLNPNHAVPVLQFKDNKGEARVMYESCAMVEFLTDALASGDLAPEVGLSAERAEYQKWLWFAGSWMDQLLWQLRLHDALLPAEDRDPKTTERTKAKWLKEIEPQIEAQLQAMGNKFILGETFTSADILVGHCLGWSKAYGLSQNEVLAAYLTRLQDRPARQAAYADGASFGK